MGFSQQADRGLARFFDLSLDAVCIAGFDGYLKMANPAYPRMLGRTADELLEQPFVAHVHPEDAESVMGILAQLAEGGDVIGFQCRQLRAGGSIRWVEWSASAEIEEELVYLVGRDVTERRGDAAELGALRRVATLVARGTAAEALFAAVVAEVGGLLPVKSASMGRFDRDGLCTTVAAWSASQADFPAGERLKPVGNNVTSMVFRTASSARLDDYSEASGPVGRRAQRAGYRSAVGAPITVEGRLWGLLTAESTAAEPLSAETEERLEKFTDLVATAIANADARESLATLADEQASLRRVAALAAAGAPPPEVFEAVAEELGRLVDVDRTYVTRIDGDDAIILAMRLAGRRTMPEEFSGQTRVRAGDLTAQVRETGGPVRVDPYQPDPDAGAVEAGLRVVVSAPIMVGDHLWGFVTAGSTGNRPPPASTEQRLSRFTELLGSMIANAESRESEALLASEQAALHRVATLIARGVPPAEIFAAVSDEVGRLFGSDAAWVVKFEESGPPLLMVGAGEGTGRFTIGTRWEHNDLYPSTRVFRTGRSVRVGRLEVEAASDPMAKVLRQELLAGTAASPIIVDGHLWGTITVSTREEVLPIDTERRLERFTELVATAISNTHTASQLARLADEQAALRRVATLVAKGVPPAEVFAAVSDEVGRLLGSDAVWVVKFEDSGPPMLLVGAGKETHGFPVGTRYEHDDLFPSTRVFKTGRSVRIGREEVEASSGPTADFLQRKRLAGYASPINVDGHLWGTITVYSGEDTLPVDTERRLERFTELVATAISNTLANAQLARLVDEQAALRRVATLVAQGVAPAQIFAAVSDELGGLIGTDLAGVIRFEELGAAYVFVGVTKSVADALPIGTRWPASKARASAQVFHTGRSTRMSERDWSAVGGVPDAPGERLGVTSTVASPIAVEGQLWGTVTVSSQGDELPVDTEQRLEKFTALIATAIANAESRRELAASRRRIVAASDEARRRIERDLHDGMQQRLVSLGLAVRAAESLVPHDQATLRDELSTISGDLARACEELQEISRGIHPAILSHGGLAAAVRGLGRRASIPATVVVDADIRLPEPIEVAVYYVVSEALANAAKHAQATRADISLEQRDGRVVLSICDDGVGGAESGIGSGLVGLIDRVEALDGTIDITSPPGRGTAITVEFRLVPDPQDQEAPAGR